MKSQWLIIPLLLSAASCTQSDNNPRQTEIVGEAGWTLWLDREAEWKHDELYLPPVDVDKLNVASPTNGWKAMYDNALPTDEAKKAVAQNLPIKVTVPGTVEEYFWDALSDNKGLGNSGDYTGVSWWNTTFKVSKEYKGRKLKLSFTEGVRQRAEIFINEKLVGYELCHQTPFDLDITDAVNYGADNRLSVRITDPGGNFSWGDYEGIKWGKYFFPLSHGFGGILGKVELSATNPLYVEDVFVKNKPSLKEVDVDIELVNATQTEQKFSVHVAIEEAWQKGEKVFSPKTIYTQDLGEMVLSASSSKVIEVSANVPEAALWEIKNANLYNWVTTITDHENNVVDIYKQRFGFRFLEVKDHRGENSRFYLNGKRTTLISAISWGYWPVNGMYPTEDLARKHIQSAFDLGMNTLNFHRCKGNELVLSLADEMGILYYQEPGGYSSHRIKESTDLTGVTDLKLGGDLNSQRFLRMVRQDRNHPSLVYYNMVNEPGWDPDEQTKETLIESHKIDPTRFKSYGSGFMTAGQKQAHKIHMIPYDETLYSDGYCDQHNAGESQGVYLDENYNSPEDFERNTKGVNEIFVWGEEGAVASPPHLEQIAKHKKSAHEKNGWDGADYEDWLTAYHTYLKEKGLETQFPSVTDLIKSMGDVMYYEHGRFLENARIADDFDIYVYNGYEDMKNDNFSGAVDVYRNVKGNPELMSQYARPLYVAVKARNKIGHLGETNLVDLYVINEHVLSKGIYEVKLRLEAPNGETEEINNLPVRITGGDTFCDFVAKEIPVNLNSGTGYYKIKAELYDNANKKIADGHDEILAVDWKSTKLGGKGAVLSSDSRILVDFIRQLSGNVEPYTQDCGQIDYLCLGKMYNGYSILPAINFVGKDGKSSGLNLDYFRGKNFDKKVDSRLSKVSIDFNSADKQIPGYDILGETEFSLRWEGYISSDVNGMVKFQLKHDDGVKIWLDDKLIIDKWADGPSREQFFSLDMTKNKLYKIKIEAYQNAGGWNLALSWNLPTMEQKYSIDDILSHVHNNGTVLLILDGVEDWLTALQQKNAIPTYKVFYPAKSWVGSTFFVKEHPFFDELPVNQAMNWEYQELVRYDACRHFGLYDMKGEEPIASVVGSPFHQIATSVGILPYGKGKIVFSSFDLLSSLRKDTKASNVPKKVLTNCLKWAIQE